MKLIDVMHLRRIFAQRENEVFSVKLALKILKFKKATTEEALLYNERVRRILDACAKTDENGNYVAGEGGILLRENRVEDYRSQMQDIDELETDATINLTETDLAELKLTIAELESIGDCLQGVNTDGCHI